MALGEPAFKEAWAAGQALSLEQAVAEALGEEEPLRADGTPPTTAGTPVALQDLTPRELDVLRLLVQGATDGAIAGELSISVRTVNKHVASVLSKTGCANRTAAVAFALRHSIT